MSVSKDPEIAVLQTQMDEVRKTGDRTEAKIDKLLERFEVTVTSFVSKDELKKFGEELEQKFEEGIKSSRNFNIITHAASALLGAFVIAIAYWLIFIILHKPH